MIEPIVKNERLMIRFQNSTAVSSRSGSSSSRAMICCASEPFDNSRRWALRSENRAASLAEKKAEQNKQDGHRQEAGEEHAVEWQNPND